MLAALGGCGVFDAPPPCPRVSVLKQAHALTLYGDESGRDPADVAFEVELGNVNAACSHDIDEEEGGGVEVSFGLEIRTARGPAAAADRMTVPYFVAIMDPSRRVIAKRTFETEIAFEEGASQAQTIEEIVQWIPLGPGETGAAHETLVGIQLTPAQLEDARRRQAR